MKIRMPSIVVVLLVVSAVVKTACTAGRSIRE